MNIRNKLKILSKLLSKSNLVNESIIINKLAQEINDNDPENTDDLLEIEETSEEPEEEAPWYETQEGRYFSGEFAVINNITYISHRLLENGDYGGAGLLGESNMEVIREEGYNLEEEDFNLRQWSEMVDGNIPREYYGNSVWMEIETPTAPIVVVYGQFGSQKLWVRADHEISQRVRELDERSYLDESDYEERSSALQELHWKDYGKYDIKRSFDKEHPDLSELLDLLGDYEIMLDCGYHQLQKWEDWVSLSYFQTEPYIYIEHNSTIFPEQTEEMYEILVSWLKDMEGYKKRSAVTCILSDYGWKRAATLTDSGEYDGEGLITGNDLYPYVTFSAMAQAFEEEMEGKGR